jgi:hypothetical protein
VGLIFNLTVEYHASVVKSTGWGGFR